MKLLIALLAAAGLSGCVAYGPAPYGYGSAYYSDAPYSPYYGSYSGGVVVEQSPVLIHRGHRGSRDFDRDGVPNRYDRDRDGDGVPNRYDAFPSDPRRR
jgi:hypothetical protein